MIGSATFINERYISFIFCRHVVAPQTDTSATQVFLGVVDLDRQWHSADKSKGMFFFVYSLLFIALMFRNSKGGPFWKFLYPKLACVEPADLSFGMKSGKPEFPGADEPLFCYGDPPVIVTTIVVSF